MRTSTLHIPEINETPSIILKIILWTTGISIASALFNNWIETVFSIPGPQYFLPLSWWGLSRLLLWQPFTFLFLETTSGAGITMNFLITLFLEMSILWIIGNLVYKSVGDSAFKSLYFKGGIFTGLLTVAIALLFGYHPFISGASASLLIVYTVWTFMNPETELLLFFLIPVKTKWILAGILGALALVNLSHLNLPYLLYYVIACGYGYNYALIYLNLPSPYPRLLPLDRFLIATAKFLSGNIQKSETLRDLLAKKAKIIDISTEKPKLDDEEFTDAMLTKISKSGEDSLTWEERKRLDGISEKKRKKSHRR